MHMDKQEFDKHKSAATRKLRTNRKAIHTSFLKAHLDYKLIEITGNVTRFLNTTNSLGGFKHVLLIQFTVK